MNKRLSVILAVIAAIFAPSLSSHLFGAQPVIGPCDSYYGNVNAREDIGWRSEDDNRTCDQDEKCEDDERVRPG